MLYFELLFLRRYIIHNLFAFRVYINFLSEFGDKKTFAVFFELKIYFLHAKVVQIANKLTD